MARHEFLGSHALTRRGVIAGLLRVGGGVLAAGLTACRPSASNASTPPATSSPVPTSTATPAPPQPTATPPADLRLTILPRSLAIPSVGLEVPVDSAAMVRNAQGRP